ncbi:unnamed protein product [Blepharisma stoltei]|uniref:Uncharacterized protein n=1 Tax=Blepharisma stoltei TaxID=1481888 RepID=A0AAU9IR06_9CILI|nr:unnamed protein product [Blepharisma stoltei]
MAIATEVFNHNKNYMPKEDENFNISWGIGHISSRNFKTSSFRSGLLSFLLNLHNLKHEVQKISFLIPMIKLAFFKVIFALQLSSIGWNQWSFNRWNSIDSFWNILGYARIDNIFSELGLLEYFLCFTVFIVWIYFILLIAIYLLTIRNKRISLILLKLENWWRLLIFGIGLIPMLYSLMIAIKYLIFYQNISMAEYQNKVLNSSLLDMVPVFIITTILLLIFYYMHEIFIYEFRHSHSSYTIYAKSHSNPDKIKFFGITIILIYSMLCDSSHLTYKKIIISTFAFIICLLNLYYIPYFTPESNFFEACSMLIAVINSIAFFIGEIQGNSSTGFVLFLFLNPILSWFLHMIFKYRYSKLVKLNSIKKYIDVYEFERAMRQSLLYKENQPQEILEIFDSAYFNNKLNISRLVTIWEADFCLNSLKNPRLASIKIGSGYPWKKPNFEEEFLEFCLRKQLHQELCQNCEDTQFLMCLEKLENWKKTDKKFCLDLIDVINLIYIDHLPVQKIFPSIVKMNKKFNYLKKDYKEIISSFPRSSEAHIIFKLDILFLCIIIITSC